MYLENRLTKPMDGPRGSAAPRQVPLEPAGRRLAGFSRTAVQRHCSGGDGTPSAARDPGELPYSFLVPADEGAAALAAKSQLPPVHVRRLPAAWAKRAARRRRASERSASEAAASAGGGGAEDGFTAAPPRRSGRRGARMRDPRPDSLSTPSRSPQQAQSAAHTAAATPVPSSRSPAATPCSAEESDACPPLTGDEAVTQPELESSDDDDDADYHESPAKLQRHSFEERCKAEGLQPQQVLADEVAARVATGMSDYKAEGYGGWVGMRKVDVPPYHVRRFRRACHDAVPYDTSPVVDPTLSSGSRNLYVSRVRDFKDYLERHTRWLASQKDKDGKSRLPGDTIWLTNILDGKSLANHGKHFSCGLCWCTAHMPQSRDCAVTFWGCCARDTKPKVRAAADAVHWGEFVQEIEGTTIELADGRVMTYKVIDSGDLPALFCIRNSPWFKINKVCGRPMKKKGLAKGDPHPQYSGYRPCPSCQCSLKEIHACDPNLAKPIPRLSACMTGDRAVYEVLHGLSTLLSNVLLDLYYHLHLRGDTLLAEKLESLLPPSFVPEGWVEMSTRARRLTPEFVSANEAQQAAETSRDDVDDTSSDTSSESSDTSSECSDSPSESSSEGSSAPEGPAGAKDKGKSKQVPCWRFDPSDMQTFFGKGNVYLARRKDGSRDARKKTKVVYKTPPVLVLAEELGECLPQIEITRTRAADAQGPPVRMWPVRAFFIGLHRLAQCALTPPGQHMMGSEQMRTLCQTLKELWLYGIAARPEEPGRDCTLYKYCSFHFGAHMVLDHWWHVHELLFDYGGIKICRRDGWENQQGAERRMYNAGAHKGGRGRLRLHKSHVLLGQTITEKYCQWLGSRVTMQAIVAAYSSSARTAAVGPKSPT